jgi:hypothetical protein
MARMTPRALDPENFLKMPPVVDSGAAK